MTGVVTIATTHKGYGLLANNLAGSLHAFSPDIPISVIYDDATATHLKSDLYDRMIHVPSGSNGFQLKTQVNTLTPYDVTIFIDADSLFIGDASQLITDAEAHEFLMMEYRRYGKGDQTINRTIWIDLPEAWQAFGLGDGAVWPEYNSSVFSFRSNSTPDLYFQQAVENYGAKAKLKELVRGEWPDEVAFSAASAQLGFMSGIPRWQPAYLEFPGGKAEPVGDVRKQYPLVTMSGRNKLKYNMDCLYNGTVGALNMKGCGLLKLDSISKP